MVAAQRIFRRNGEYTPHQSRCADCLENADRQFALQTPPTPLLFEGCQNQMKMEDSASEEGGVVS
jgi:hypothetical protein